ncbi:MAG: MBL fold metallo-hydrolase [Tannerella sp.]|jgi:glyoxylase-like metal-dependent hydrolase (beta-lactamase superfamily II)|nr:MBL fold metallo-hydrolase [Tannerella sp.]
MILIKQFTFNFFGENTYLLHDETKEAVVIDCGCLTPGEENILSGYVKEHKLTLKRLLCTHYHFDHVVGNAYIFHEYGIRPELHKEEKNIHTPTLTMQASKFGIPMSFEEIEPLRNIEDNEEIHFGHSTLKAILVPGHSPASLAFYSEAGRFLIAGDVIFSGSIGRTDLWGGSYNTLISGIRNRILTLPDDITIYPGHGPSTTVSHEKANNPYLS